MTSPEKPKLSKRAQSLLEKLNPPAVLCASSDATEAGLAAGGLFYWIEPFNRRVGPATARELISSGALVASPDGLLQDCAQSWRKA